MSDKESPPPEMVQALELADGYLNDAQNVLWTTASELSDDTRTELLEELTEEIWTLQHELNDLQREFEQ